MVQLDKQVEDKRGKIFFLSFGDKKINVVEMKKGFSRGGHYHNFPSTHTLIYGQIELREENIETGIEEIKNISAPATIFVKQNVAHLFTAIENSMFIEVFDGNYQATNYLKYRKIVDEKIS